MKTNDKVVCVDDGPVRRCETATMYAFPNGLPVKGQVYVVIGIFQPSFVGRYYINTIGIQVSGKPAILFGTDTGWHPRRFRLVSEVGHPPIEVEQPQAAEV